MFSDDYEPTAAQAMDITPITSIPVTACMPSSLTNQAYLRDYWAAKKREQRSKERDPNNNGRAPTCKSRKNIISAVARCWRNQTRGLSVSEQKELFQELLQHHTFSKLQLADVESGLVSGIRNTLTQLKVPRSANELFVKKTSLSMVLNTTGGSAMNQSKIATILGVHRRNIAAATSRLHMKDEDEVLPLAACQRSLHRGTHVSSETRDLVYAFWSSETRVSPNKKDICKLRIEGKSVVKHPTHFLDDSQVHRAIFG